MSGIPAEWHGRAHFHEIAEVLGITTEYIMAALVHKEGRYFVLYTPHYAEGDETIYSAWLHRQADGVLTLSMQPLAHPGAWEQMKGRIEEMIRKLEEEGFFNE